MDLRLSDFDYPLDSERIAQVPAAKRDESRMMVLTRSTGQACHHVFRELPGLLREEDLLVLNDTLVIPAKFAVRRATGGKIEGLFLREFEAGLWQVMLSGAGRCKPGERLSVAADPEVGLELLENLGQGQWRVAVAPSRPAAEILKRVGTTPLPPYIHRPDGAREPLDRPRYQTVYAARPGAVAAPTAGLHFTRELLDGLRAKGIECVRVTLHVGLGTFAPVQCERISEHTMHAEWYELSAAAAEQLNAARRAARRVVAVGTTSVRVLESAVSLGDEFAPGRGWTDLFLYPPADFAAVDAMVTNFHLPKSTLLMLVAAFCAPGRTDGLGTILAAYAEAARLRYRFYSYGDAMLIE